MSNDTPQEDIDPIVEAVAKAIAASGIMHSMVQMGVMACSPERITGTIDALWCSKNDQDRKDRESYIRDAKAAISAHIAALKEQGVELYTTEEITALREENGRLREALAEIVNIHDEPPRLALYKLNVARRIARAALKGDE